MGLIGWSIPGFECDKPSFWYDDFSIVAGLVLCGIFLRDFIWILLNCRFVAVDVQYSRSRKTLGSQNRQLRRWVPISSLFYYLSRRQLFWGSFDFEIAITEKRIYLFAVLLIFHRRRLGHFSLFPVCDRLLQLVAPRSYWVRNLHLPTGIFSRNIHVLRTLHIICPLSKCL